METSFSIKTPQFEGPLELLLNLIEERKLLISDISLSSVADDFLGYIQRQVAFPIGQAAHFILVAATLLLLKSRSLLPVLSLTKEEEGNVKDLEFRLTLYKIFRDTAKEISTLHSRMFFGTGSRNIEPLFTPSNDLSLQSIQEATERVLASAPKEIERDEVAVKSVISLEEMIDRLSGRIERAIQMTFRDFAGTSAVNKREVVVSFLAMLELFKRGLVLVEQEQTFGEIAIAYNGNAKTPKF
ncbi:MAG: segregation and condensation protein A [Parcubacteria group bacterium Greene0714_7]|nr:MAG: segregation and condensation protein A [Parcubacteria group bacterium Greene0714_7]